MKKEEIIDLIGKPILSPAGKLLLLSWIGLFSSPFVWIWINCLFALKIFSTCFIIIILLTIIIKFVKNIISEEMDKEEKTGNKESRFQKKLNEIIEKNNKK